MNSSFDVVIIGGAVMGAATAYFLAANPDFDGSILVVERDTSFAQASTALSAASIRVQFSSALNVQISKFGISFIRDFANLMEVDGDRPNLNFHAGGYLFLAGSDAQAQTLQRNHEVQKQCGADVVLWTADELKQAFPHLNCDDIRLASYGHADEGWFDNMGLLQGFRAKAKSLGVTFVQDEVIDLYKDGQKIIAADLKKFGRVELGWVVNCSGPRAAQVAQMAGLNIPVEPRKRTTFVFDCMTSPEGSATVNGGRLPLMIDPSGVYCRPEGKYFMAACSPDPDPSVDFDDFDPRYEEFEDVVWPVLAHRSPAFEAIKVLRQWAGHYAYNTLDQNLIVGPHPEITNFVFANGFSGHGLQQSPATGRAIAEWIAYGAYRSLDFSAAGYERVTLGKQVLETAVI